MLVDVAGDLANRSAVSWSAAGAVNRTKCLAGRTVAEVGAAGQTSGLVLTTWVGGDSANSRMRGHWWSDMLRVILEFARQREMVVESRCVVFIG